jgi:hypothetical protein
MSFLSDILNPTLLIFLGITLLIIALLIVYFESKMREQNHKIASMLSLVSSLAEETNGMKFHLNHMIMNGLQSQNISSADNNLPFQENKYLEETLIHVSDDDEDDDDDDEEDDDEDDEDDEDEDDDEHDEDDDDDEDEDEDDCELHNIHNITINELNDNDIKVLNLDNLHDSNNKNKGIDHDEVEDNTDEEDEDEEDEEDEDEDEDLEDIDFNQLSENDDDNDNDNDNSNEQTNTINTLKSINILNLEEDQESKNKSLEVIDYKKLSISKLKSIVLEKGIVTDSSKLKKQDLLKLLNSE